MNNMTKKILSLLVLLIAASGAWAADGIACTTEDVGKLICTDGTIYATKAEAETAGKTAVAKIMVIDAANNTGLAFALAEEPGESMQWGAAEQVCEGKNQSTPVAGATWAMPTKDQWNAVATAAGGFNALVSQFGLGDRSYYWSSTTVEGNSSNAWRYDFDWGQWDSGSKTNSEARAIACLTFNVVDPNAVVVNTNAEQGETYFTEASFDMPDYDATVAFDIVRDMEDATYPVAFSGIPAPATTGGVSKIVVKKKSDGKFEFLKPTTIALIDPLAATDAQDIIAAKGITIKVLKGTETTGGAIDFDQDNPITLAEFLEDTRPGYYWIKAVPTDETTSPYIGTVYSYEMLLINGYEVEVPAKEYVTYYKDEKLTLEESETSAKIYTITNVSDNKATATELTVAPANKAILVRNTSETEAKTILLIPTDDQADDVEVYPGFTGTLEPATIAASTEALTNYAFNGKQFVWVMTDLPVAANKAWLAIPAATARSITLTFEGETTGVGHTEITEITEKAGGVYDLSGRRVAKPAKKGVYVKDGRKVVVK